MKICLLTVIKIKNIGNSINDTLWSSFWALSRSSNTIITIDVRRTGQDRIDFWAW